MYNTIEPQPSSKMSISRRDTLTRNSSSMATRPKTSSLALHITKTISNYFFKPEKLPLAMQERNEPKTIAKPFYTKNRKLISIKNKKETPLPNGFKNMLRAKSTVIKQKKLQQFYINREGRESEGERLKYTDFVDQNSKSNLFRSNVPMKKARQRNVNSVSLEKKPQLQLNQDEIQMPGKAMTIYAPTQDLTEIVLKQKKWFTSNDRRQKQEPSPKINWHNLRKKKKPLTDKQNVQFLIEPWKGAQNDDLFF